MATIVLLMNNLMETLLDKYSIGLDKGVSGKYFSYFSTKTYVVGTH